MPEKSVGVAGQTMSQTRSLCQETVVKWFANYTMTISATAQQAAKSRLVTRPMKRFLEHYAAAKCHVC